MFPFLRISFENLAIGMIFGTCQCSFLYQHLRVAFLELST